MLKVETLHLELNPWRLLFGVVEIDELHLHGSELRIEAGANDVKEIPNSGTSEAASGGGGVEIRLNHLKVEDLRIYYDAESTATDRVVDISKFSLDAEAFDEPLAVELNGVFEGDEFAVRGEIGSIPQLLNRQDPYPVSLRADMRKMNLEFEGTLVEPTKFRGVDVRVRLDARDLAFLHATVEWSLPAIDSVHLDARLTDDDGSLGIQGEISVAAQDGEISGEISGRLGDLARNDDVALRISLSARDLAEIGESLVPELKLPDVGPVTASVLIRGNTSALSAEGFAVKIGSRDGTWLEVSGSVADLANFTGVHLAGEFAGADLRYANLYIDHELPDVGPIRGNAKLSDRDGSLGLEEVRIAGGREDALTFDFSGRIDQMLDRDEINVDAKIEAKSLTLIGDLFGIELPPIAPVSFSGTLNGSDEKIESHGSTRLDKTILIGDWSGSFAGVDRRSIKAKLQSKHVWLDDIGIMPRSADEDADEDRANSPSWWSSHDPLPFELLEAIDADLVIEADRVSGIAGFELDGVLMSIRLEDGRLEIPEFAVGYEAGTVRTQGFVDVSGSRPELALKVEVNAVNLTPLLAQVRQAVEEAGVLDASIDVKSRGNHPIAIRSNLAGTVRLIARDGALAGRYSSTFAKNFVALAVPSILTGRAPQFGCVVTDFEIESGVASVRELFLESEMISVVGSGTIDFRADAFDIVLVPKVHEPGLVSLSAAVDVSGPLAAPVFSPRYTNIPLQAVRGVVSNVLAPGSALIKPFRRSKDKSPCDSLRPVATPGE
ncbi:MAG: AsmA family protein [Deltaproteobacteria bacterium]|nr:AsmA family protein [Deltaproteobacteria bacterium]